MGILRAKGRFDHANLKHDDKYPMVLLSDYCVELLTRDAHETVMHSGVNDTMAFLRQRF